MIESHACICNFYCISSEAKFLEHVRLTRIYSSVSLASREEDRLLFSSGKSESEEKYVFSRKSERILFVFVRRIKENITQINLILYITRRLRKSENRIFFFVHD